jgi:Leucine-rich repeat (LRR) protein
MSRKESISVATKVSRNPMQVVRSVLPHRLLHMVLALVFSGFASLGHAVIPMAERQFLLDLYTNTNGAGWTASTNWNGVAGTECAWEGITCSAGDANVTRIDLSSNNLVGILPSTLNQLSALLNFNAYDNQLTGAIPALTGLSALLNFNAYDNQLTGAIPALTGLSALQHFDVGSNQLTGTIPALTGLSALEDFDVSSNQLTGAIPALTGLSALRVFSADRNQLTGAIPVLTGLSALRVFRADRNQLTGAIPALTGLSALAGFSVFDNQLTGAIPALAGLTALSEFCVNNNQLTDAIPALTGLSALRRFEVFNNQLTGAIPALTGLSALRYFDVSSNQLTGTIPALTGLSALASFRADQNQLTGAIPALNGLSDLRIFRVENNQLTGAIPAVPAPTNALFAGSSDLCPNQLTVSVDAAWDAATGSTPWSTDCTAALPNQTLTFGAAPTLTVGGTGTVTATAAPTPNSANPVVYASLTPLVCSVNAASGLVTVQPSAVAGDTCTLTADKAGDATANSAPQVQQSIVIVAAPINGTCGTANGVASLNAPSANLCGAGTASSVTTNAVNFTWSCNSDNGGTNASCAAPRSFTVAANAGVNGSLSCAPNPAVYNQTTSCTAVPNAGYVTQSISGCGGVATGVGVNSYTTGAVLDATCAVTAVFSAAPTAAAATPVPTLGHAALALLAMLTLAVAGANLRWRPHG